MLRIDRFLDTERIVDLKSREYRAALLELLALCPPDLFNVETPLDPAAAVERILTRERAIPSRIGNTVAMPHLFAPLRPLRGASRRFVFAVGRCARGLVKSDDPAGKKITILFLVLVADGEKESNTVLSVLAGTLEEENVVKRFMDAPTLADFRAVVTDTFKNVTSGRSALKERFNKLMWTEAEKIAKGAGCSAMLVFTDTFSNPVRLPKQTAGGVRVITVSRREYDLGDDDAEAAGGAGTGNKAAQNSVIVRGYAHSRFAQLRGALLVALLRGILKPDERVCCLGGVAESNRLDIVLTADLSAEFSSVLSKRADLLPAGVKADVLERALGIATELSIEGREGKPVGCLFVIGNRDELKPLVKPLIMNPFFGYPEEERSILGPFLEETVKELSLIDGAIVINGDGVIDSAGSMLIAGARDTPRLPSGLGTRHAAANAISIAADCIAIVVSSSTGQVTLFRRGETLTVFERVK
jgi:DNA integrity scanning protein DisA with diadenylate cyclase activity/mannitol/fructose-specific phosphotransferase system IIA component (Ntr-type)